MRFIDCMGTYTTTLVTVEHKNKIYSGKARLHPDDEEFVSPLTGGHIAEERAIISALKDELLHKKEDFHICENMLKDCINSKKFNKEEDSAKVLFHQLNIRKRDILKLQEEIKDREYNLKKYIWKKDNINKRSKEAN